jgi:ATP phosphoribosyltransferase regulatory subunit
MTFEGYAADLGFPVCSGGRYDNLLTQFGRPAPATGFALKTTRIMEMADKEATDEPSRVLILYDAAHREEALQCANEMRSRVGMRVETRRIQQEAEVELEAIKLQPEGGYRYLDRVYEDVIPFV